MGVKNKQRRKSVSISQANDGNSVVVEGRINSTLYHFTINTGASHTVISSQLLVCLPKDHLQLKHLQLLMAARHYISIRDDREVAVKSGDKLYCHTVILADIVEGCMTGMDFIRRYHCKIYITVAMCFTIRVLKCGL